MPVADSDCYELNGGCYAVYGYEYKPGFVEDKAVCTSPHTLGLRVDTILSAQYITWINDNKTAWTMNVAGTAADSRVNIGPRPVPQEPMVGLPRVLFPTKSLITFVGLRFSLCIVHHSQSGNFAQLRVHRFRTLDLPDRHVRRLREGIPETRRYQLRL